MLGYICPHGEGSFLTIQLLYNPNRILLETNDGIYDIDEADPWNSTTPSVVAFRNLYRHNETLMNNTFQQFVRDEMPPIIRKFDARTDGEVVCDPLLGWVCWPIAAWTVVTVEVVDPSPYTVTITVLDNGRSRSFNL